MICALNVLTTGPDTCNRFSGLPVHVAGFLLVEGFLVLFAGTILFRAQSACPGSWLLVSIHCKKALLLNSPFCKHGRPTFERVLPAVEKTRWAFTALLHCYTASTGNPCSSLNVCYLMN